MIKKPIALVLLLSLLLFAATTFSGKVVGISDGDTIRVLHENKEIKIRLYGIDTPEKKQAFGNRAKQFASDFCFNKTAQVIVRDIDFYGRTVAEVWVDGESLNQALVKNGFAWWYKQYAPKDTLLKRLEMEARAEKRGLWSDKSPQEPWKWRKAQKKRSTKGKDSKKSNTKKKK